VAIHYEKAPIIEALIDIRVELSGPTLEQLESIHNTVKRQYPGKAARAYVQGVLSWGTEVSAVSNQRLVGYSFSSEDGRQIFQARLDGLTFGRLRPYGSWPELRDEARRLWEIYREISTPQKITRVAVRYINQIDIPIRQIDYKDYFRTTPEVSSALPQGLSGFFMQLHFPQPDFEGILILTQTAVPPPSPDTNSVILDLDVFRQQMDITSDEEVWNLLEILRERKNEFFEASITDRTRALFGERKEY
jgi:uncharacterized protein (TIGR04255 family)